MLYYTILCNVTPSCAVLCCDATAMLYIRMHYQPRELPFLPRALPPSSKGFTLPSDTERGDIIKPISVSNEAAVLQLFKEKALAQVGDERV